MVFSRNQLLLTFAKDNGVKGVRKGMKTSTLIEKIQNSKIKFRSACKGLDYC